MSPILPETLASYVFPYFRISSLGSMVTMAEQREAQMASDLYGHEPDVETTSPRFEYPPKSPPADSNQDHVEDVSDEELDIYDLPQEDAQSLVGVSISRAANRLMSPTVPATEKAAAMDDLDRGGLFPSDEDITPPPEAIKSEQSHPVPQEESSIDQSPPNKHVPFLSDPPLPHPEDLQVPSPWTAGPKALVVERLEETRSVIRGALDITKRRSLSGGADALKKLLPSMPKAGSFVPSMPSTSMFSSSGTQKGRSRAFSLRKDLEAIAVSSTNSGSNSPLTPTNKDKDLQGVTKTDSISSSKLLPIRRAASDDSLLYHSVSRTSSLGDDARFENHREMINSRVKAIRDSLQDRSSFKLPNMPSMPRVPSFSTAMNYAFNLNPGVVPINWKASTDLGGDIIPGNTRKRLIAAPNPALAPGMIGASISRPEVAIASAQAVAEGPSDGHLDRAIVELTGDVVILGGYRGSILRSAKPPHRRLWVPVKVGLNIRKVNLEVGLDAEDEERMEESIFASGMLQNIGPVDISRRLFKRLRECENVRNGTLRVWDYGYDWRLSPHILSKKLLRFVESLPSNQPGIAHKDKGALIIAHSLGGMITRHAVNQCPELFSGVIFAGVPQACVNILGPMRNGDAVLLSSRVLTAQVNFSFRTSFVLLPLEGYCFMDITTGEEYPVDYFNVDDWIKYRWSPCTDPPLPPKAQPTGGLANILRQGSFTNLQLSGLKLSNTAVKRNSQTQIPSPPSPLQAGDKQNPNSVGIMHTDFVQGTEGQDRTIAPQMGNQPNPVKHGHSTNSSVSTAVTVPREKAIAYLRRILAQTKQFKLELAHNVEHEKADRYPPFAIIYGKSVPTVYAAKVDGRDGIACADSYDNLAFASGDGVCLSREAMLPDGYYLVKGGRISSDRGHLTLLGDLNAVGRAILAVTKGRGKGMGLGRFGDNWEQA